MYLVHVPLQANKDMYGTCSTDGCHKDMYLELVQCSIAGQHKDKSLVHVSLRYEACKIMKISVLYFATF